MSFDAKLKAQLERIGHIPTQKAMEAGANVFLAEMQLNTPVDTGDLLESESVKVEGTEVTLVAESDHAVFVEFGTSRMEAQPYMRPALENKQNEALRAIATQMEEEIRKAANG